MKLAHKLLPMSYYGTVAAWGEVNLNHTVYDLIERVTERFSDADFALPPPTAGIS